MKRNDVRFLSVIILIVFTTIFQLSAQKILHETPREIPFVYSLENSVAPTTVHLPTFDELPVVETLPDPFAWSDGSGRSTRFEDWSRRRMEIGAEIQHYEIGEKPSRPDSITADFSNDTLTVWINVNGEQLILKSQVVLPVGEGPFPAVIGIGMGSGSLPADLFSSRNIALTIAQESGGGGAAAWRVSETLGEVETLGRTNFVWFMESLSQFSDDVNKLPYDHHELMAMVAPHPYSNEKVALWMDW